ncbi:hypothetical protein MTO96_021248 [Rhipicephalus appendiculatus]
MRHEGRERSKRQCDQPRTSALAPVMHSPVRSHRRLLWTVTEWAPLAAVCSPRCTVVGRSRRKRQDSKHKGWAGRIRGSEGRGCLRLQEVVQPLFTDLAASPPPADPAPAPSSGWGARRAS